MSEGGTFKYKQDMPPTGGYRKIWYQRTFPKLFLNAPKILMMWSVGIVLGVTQLKAVKKNANRAGLEHQDCEVALQPFFLAERDRNHLKWMRYLRDEEREVMKDVPGWKVGTWYGEPLYFTPGEQFLDIHPAESMSMVRNVDEGRIRDFYSIDEHGGEHFYDKYLPQWFNRHMP